MARKYKTVGKNPYKLEGTQKVTGAAKYAGDIYLPGMLHGKIKRSPHAHAKVIKIDCKRALALDGVRAVITFNDVPAKKHAGAPAPRRGGLVADQNILTGHARFVGDGVAAVAADSVETAQEALELIEVEYQVLPAVFDPEEAMGPGAPNLHGAEKNLATSGIAISRGDVLAGFSKADIILEREYSTGRPAPAYMEPNICLCSFDLTGKLTVWSSTQCAFMVRGTLAEQLGLPMNKVRVIAEHMGGSFGAKQDCYQHEYVCALLAQKTDRPVRMEYSRAESFWASKTRHPVKVRMKQGVTRDGVITARQADYTANTGAYASHAVGITWWGWRICHPCTVVRITSSWRAGRYTPTIRLRALSGVSAGCRRFSPGQPHGRIGCRIGHGPGGFPAEKRGERWRPLPGARGFGAGPGA